jgi:predicted transcriptional regulator
MSTKITKTVGDNIEKTRMYHKLYLRAVSNPLRRNILIALKQGPKTIDEMRSFLNVDSKLLRWHLNILENGFCVEKENEGKKAVYKITQEGKVVDYLQKSEG